MDTYFKVMFVDDEILAIRHMQGLLDWEKYGFTVVCHATQPQKALEMIAEYQPQVLFVDIKMPVMDGMELSKAVLAAGYKGLILLLTSVKQFDYAQQALKLGIHNYLVKHELNADTLLEELLQIRKRLEQQNHDSAIIKRKMYNDLLLNRKGSTLRTIVKEKDGGTNRWFSLIIMQLKTAYPVIPGLGKESFPEDLPDILEAGVKNSLYFDEVEIVPMDGNRIAILLETQNGHSERQLLDREQHFAIEMRSLSKLSVAIVIAPPVREREKIHESYSCAENMLNRAVFWCNQPIVRCTPYPSQSKSDFSHSSIEKNISSSIFKLAECAEVLDIEAANRHLYALFEQIEVTCDPNLLSGICRELISLLHRIRVSPLESIEQLVVRSSNTEKEWVSFDGIRNWFMDRFQETFDALRTSRKYSRKVEQALLLLRERYGEELNAELIAEQLQISSDHLRHMFKEETGKTLLDTLTEIRIEKAKELLASGHYKIYEVAEKVGYRRSQYFSQVFRKITGINPLDYTDRQRNPQI